MCGQLVVLLLREDRKRLDVSGQGKKIFEKLACFGQGGCLLFPYCRFFLSHIKVNLGSGQGRLLFVFNLLKSFFLSQPGFLFKRFLPFHKSFRDFFKPVAFYLGKNLYGLFSAFLVDVNHQISGKINNLLDSPWGNPQKQRCLGWGPFEKPDVDNGCGEGYVPHPLAPDSGLGDLDSTLVTNDAFVPDSFVLSAVALPVLGRTEDSLVEKSIFFGL